MIDYYKFGEKLQKLRKEKGLSQLELAEALSVSAQAVSNWERGLTMPDLENLVLIAKEFDVLVDSLLVLQDKKSYIAVDGGGTKTEFVVFTPSGTVLKSFKLFGCNPNDIGMNACLDILEQGISQCLIDHPHAERAHVGISGALAGNNKQVILEKLSEKFRNLQFNVDTDCTNLFACSPDCDTALICGTGSAVYYKEKQQWKLLGGWGYLFDESGSAYDLGKDALRVTLAVENGLFPPCLLSKLITKRLDESITKSLSKIYERGKRYIASFADLVFTAHEQGDEVAKRILEKSAKRLAFLLDHALKNKKNKRVIVGGGIFVHQPKVFSAILKKYTTAELQFCEFPPVYGACIQCHTAFEEETPKNFYENFKKSYGEIIK